MRILFLLLFFSCILCGKAWAQPQIQPLGWELNVKGNARTQAIATPPYVDTLKLPLYIDFSSRYFQIDRITTNPSDSNAVEVYLLRPHGLLDGDSILVSGARVPADTSVLKGIKYVDTISTYAFRMYDNKTRQTNTTSAAAITYLRLSKVGAKETAIPDTLLFYYNKGGVQINGGSAKNQPSYYVARFDGLRENGVPYNTTSQYAIGFTDTLISQAIDLSKDSLETNVYMSFYYQHGGFGEQPDAGDHLYLDFLDDTLHWNQVYDLTGTTGNDPTKFYPILIPLIDSGYFHKGFKYRFRSYGRQTGAYDVWNVDAIYLNRHRDAADLALEDFAFRDADVSFLKNSYTAMPFNHFFSTTNDTTYFKNIVQTTATNQSGIVPKNVAVYISLKDQNGLLISSAKTDPETGTFTEKIFKDTLQPILFPVRNKPQYFDLYYAFDDDLSVDLDIDSFDLMFNNVLTKRTYLYDYYAYDDSEAEAGFGSNFSGVEIAYQFVSEKTDSLTHIDICFTRNKESSLENFQIYLMVWGDTVLVDKDHPQLYKEPISVHYPSTINGFVRYELTHPIVVDSAKKFHIGYRKNFAQLLTVGYDRNRDARSKSYYKESTQWFRMDNPHALVDDSGSMMIRPVFYKASNNVPVGIHPAQADNKNKLLLYPNPASNSIDIVSTDEISDFNYVMYSLYGQIVASGRITSTEHTIDVAQLNSGMYLVRCTDEKGTIYTTRFIKE